VQATAKVQHHAGAAARPTVRHDLQYPHRLSPGPLGATWYGRGQVRDRRMRLEQLFPLIASLALLVWLAPSVFRMAPSTRELTSKIALGMIVAGVLVALGAYALG
jgi:hypothetical protein